MKNILQLFLSIIFLFSAINSFAECKANDNLACPTATISYSSSMYCSSISNPQTVNLIGTDAYLGGTFSSMPLGLNLNPTTGAFIPSSSTPGTYTITYTIAAGPGCPSYETTTIITITEQPNAGTDGTIYVCDGTPIDLFSVITGEQSGGFWVRTGGSGGTFNAVAGTFAITLGTTTTSTFEYILTSSAPCANDSSVATVIIGSIPTISSIVANQTSICNNQSVTLTLNSNPTATSYNWYVNTVSGVEVVGASSGTSTTNSINLQLALTNATTAGTINFTVTPVNGNCIGNTEISTTISVNPIPGTPIGLPDLEICSDEMTNLFISSFPYVDGTTLEWTVVDSQNVTGFTAGSGLSPINISDNLYNSTNIQGYVKYRVQSKLGNCYGGYTDYLIFVNPNPNAGLDGEIWIGENSPTVDLFSIIMNEESGGTWTRITGTGGTFDAILGTFTPAIGTTDSFFKYEITNISTYCSKSSYATLNIQPLNSETFTANNIKLSPNPVTDILNIENEFQINSIKIYNQLGQMIFGKEINNNTTQLDISVYNSGIYNVLIETEKGTVNYKIVKK